MFIFVARLRNPERKPALLAEIIEYMLDKPLSALTFRALADGLGVSTYTLVYHFGTRAELVAEIVQAVSERQDFIVTAVASEAGEIEAHLVNLRTSWKLSLQPRNLQLQKLEFEAAIFEARESRQESTVLGVFRRWHEASVDALICMGMNPTDADLEARVIVGTIYGLHYDLMVTRDTERVSAAFERALDGYEQRLTELLEDEELDEVS